MLKLKKLEYGLVAAVLALLAVGIFGPFVGQPAHQHDFADQRSWGGIAFVMDVLSNMPFALWGLIGLVCLSGLTRRSRRSWQGRLTALFFTGLVATAAASSWYHSQPDDVGLGIDRLGMVVAFAGLLGLAVAGRAGDRAGAAMALAVLLLGPLSIWCWLASGQVLPWLLVQFGGMVLVLWMAALKPLPGALAVRWGWVIGIYSAAKLLELADHSVYAWTAHSLSGHSLKHVVASFAAWPVVWALVRSQNPCRIHVANSDGSPAH